MVQETPKQPTTENNNRVVEQFETEPLAPQTGLEQIRNLVWQMVQKIGLRNLPKNDLEGIKDDIHQLISNIIKLIKFAYKLNKYTNLIKKISEIPGGKISEEDRIKNYAEKIQNILEEEGGFNTFWKVLETIVQNEERQPVRTDAPLLTLKRNRELLIGFIEGVRRYAKEGGTEDIYQLIAHRTEMGKSPSQQKLRRDFTGASIPHSTPAIQEFVKKGMDHPNQHKLFLNLIKYFQYYAEPFTDESIPKEGIMKQKQMALVTQGALPGFRLFCPTFIAQNPDYEIFRSSEDYIPMFKELDERRITTIEYDRNDPKKFESDLIEKLKASKAKKQVVFLSSITRKGDRIVTSELIIRLKREIPEVEIWIDGAQDNMPFPEADLAIYSKRIGRTGAGMILLGQTYRKDKRYTAKLKIDSGYPLRSLLSLCATLYTQRTQVGNQLRNLLTTPTLWKYSGKGTYIEEQSKRFKKELEGSAFANHFEEFHTDESGINNTNYWKFAKIITFNRKPDSTVNPRRIRKMLRENKIEVDAFSVSSLDGWEELIQATCENSSKTPNKALINLMEKISEFQSNHGANLTGILTLPGQIKSRKEFEKMPEEEARKEFNAQVKYLHKCAGEQEFIRVFIDTSMSPSDIGNLIKKLGKISIPEQQPS